MRFSDGDSWYIGCLCRGEDRDSLNMRVRLAHSTESRSRVKGLGVSRPCRRKHHYAGHEWLHENGSPCFGHHWLDCQLCGWGNGSFVEIVHLSLPRAAPLCCHSDPSLICNRKYPSIGLCHAQKFGPTCAVSPVSTCS